MSDIFDLQLAYACPYPGLPLQEPWGDMKPMQIVSMVGVLGQRLPLPSSQPHPDCPHAYLCTINDCWAADPVARPSFAAIVRRYRTRLVCVTPSSTMLMLRKMGIAIITAERLFSQSGSD